MNFWIWVLLVIDLHEGEGILQIRVRRKDLIIFVPQWGRGGEGVGTSHWMYKKIRESCESL